MGFVPYNPESGKICFAVQFHYPDFRLVAARWKLGKEGCLYVPARQTLFVACLLQHMQPVADISLGCPRREEPGSGLEWIILSDFGSQSLIDGIANLIGKVFIGCNQRALNPPVSFLLGSHSKSRRDRKMHLGVENYIAKSRAESSVFGY